jgi:phosphoglycolate phosphatase-like HAD superfamily hydrolase
MEKRPTNLTTQTAAAVDRNPPPPRKPGASSTSQPKPDPRMNVHFLNNNN